MNHLKVITLWFFSTLVYGPILTFNFLLIIMHITSILSVISIKHILMSYSDHILDPLVLPHTYINNCITNKQQMSLLRQMS